MDQIACMWRRAYKKMILKIYAAYISKPAKHRSVKGCIPLLQVARIGHYVGAAHKYKGYTQGGFDHGTEVKRKKQPYFCQKFRPVHTQLV